MPSKTHLATRVLMTADTVGGVWTYALELAAMFEGAGVEVALATMGGPVSDAQHEDVARLSNVELFQSDFKLEWMDDAWDDVQRAGEWLLDVEAQVVPDIVHLNGYVHAALDWYAPCLVVAHSCSLSWWEAVRNAPIPDRLETYRQQVWRGLHAAQAVVAPSQAMLYALEQHYGVLSDACVVPNAVDPRAFEPATKMPYVLAAGRVWDDAKNLRLLADVAPSLAWPVVIAGESSSPDKHSLSLNGVRALGALPRPALAEWLSRASIYALPARYEPFGLSVLEAAWCGCALVLGDIPSLRENWVDAAVFVDPDDAVALERMLAFLIADEGRCRELARAAAQRATEFAPERTRDAYLQLYADVMAQRRKSREESATCTS